MPSNHEKVGTHKPEWLKVKLHNDPRYADVAAIVRRHDLHTICSSGRCPNISECWSRGTATFMIGGDTCTRACRFCATKSSAHPAPLDPNEPIKIARSVQLMGLRHAVITSVDRDDLPDLGAAHWAATLSAIREMNPDTTVEALIPDFQGREELIAQVIQTRPDILSHNMETVRRITPLVRSVARYESSLKVIRQIAESGITAKSGIMVGLGETPEEVEEVMDDLLACGCRILTIGQYLQPSRRHYPVHEYVTPEQFRLYKETGERKGFAKVESGPLVRSSYHAEKHLLK